MHNFAECVQVVAEVKRAEKLDKTKIVLVTDAAGLDKADVRRGLELMDANQGEIWAKLDAGTEVYFRKINRTSVQFERILKNLKETARVRPIVIQSLFLKAHGEMMPAAELDAHCARLNEIVSAKRKNQGSARLHRGAPDARAFATKLSAAELTAIADQIRQKTKLESVEF